MKNYALVTGASGEIGQAIAREMAAQGYNLYLHYFRNKHAVEKLQIEFSSIIECKLIKANLAVQEGPRMLAEQIKTPIDVFIYNCGSSHTGLITDVSEKELDGMVQLQLKSPFQLIQQLLPSMIERKKGSIVMITSIWGQTGASCEVLYSMVKGGMNTMVKALSKELAPSGIRVNAVAPGIISTKMNEHLSEKELEEISEEIPLGRFGLPEEVSDAVGYLVSKKSSYVTGHILPVNGAWYC
ncbi:elongation factor P 5-aminopentanone reductase [Pseudalkalibacillus salsuginis]|uniref:elongation factor P 5-aminopentanone reductase n=1 Tax=Pseudalkalibacillus salsuginis TaxID=2910972 RepID=UPI001F369DB3|nr:SDR family oxidoreductase [Pseudalkalibacillus salsuginis]MCF6410635.1 SDR family oxidoreductase [Pseudalkalibacillus salsuginis]